MNGISLSAAARLTGGDLHGADADFIGAGIDTRSLQPGELFVALKGERQDGHAFVAEAAARGAAAALVTASQAVALPQLVVKDTRWALGVLAAAWRARFDLPLIGVTGSNGKTTVKEMIAAILRECGEVLVTQGNLNNDLGVPLTLFRLREQHRYAVIEMGANHIGEIAYVARLARPTVAMITNAGAAHLEGFGSREGVARGKGEIYDALASDGVAVLNVNDAYAGYWRGVIGARRVIGFGYSGAEFGVVEDSMRLAEDGELGSVFTLATPQGELSVRLQLLGMHNALNACAAAAASMAVGASLEQVRRGLAAMRAVKGRLQIRRVAARIHVIDDTYNANPDSLRAALQVLTELPGKHVLVLGDMGELGENAQDLHAAMGAEARRSGVHRLLSAGVLSAHAAAAFGDGACHYATQAEMIAALPQAMSAGDEDAVTVLVKGSRSAQMENVVTALVDAGARSAPLNSREDGK